MKADFKFSFVNLCGLVETSQEVIDALHMFGFSDFRPGQEAAIMRVLCGQLSDTSLSFCPMLF